MSAFEPPLPTPDYYDNDPTSDPEDGKKKTTTTKMTKVKKFLGMLKPYVQGMFSFIAFVAAVLSIYKAVSDFL